jgi:copper resistance protein B
MKRMHFLPALLAPVALSLALPAFAQHHAPPGSTGHADHPAAAAPAADHAAMGHAAPATSAGQEAARTAPAAADAIDHSSMDHSSMDDSSMDHSGMDPAAMGQGTPTAGLPKTPIPVPTAADRAAAAPPAGGHPMHGEGVHSLVLFNRLEAFDADPGSGLAWEGEAWIGTDLDRLWLRTEGERHDGRTGGDVEALYGRAVARWWDVVVGIRHDLGPGPSQDFLAVGAMGVAPYKFEVAATAYAGRGGQGALRLEAEYDVLLTNRLVLQPLVEADAYRRTDPSRGIGSGLATAEAGLRLRYEVTRRFAPYAGLVREWAFGRTAALRRAEGEAASDTRLVAGVRVWF